MAEQNNSGLMINNDACVGCGVCVGACPFGALSMDDGTAVVDQAVCTLCGACVEHCPIDAIELIRQTRQAMNPDDWSGVWVYAEVDDSGYHPVVFELLGAGSRLAKARGTDLTAVVLGSLNDASLAPLFMHGADRVIVADHDELACFRDEPYARILVQLVREHKPEIVLAGATTIGRALIPRAATTLGTGLTADCTGLEIDTETGNLLQTRPAFGGNIMARIVCAGHRPQMATVRPRVMEAPEPNLLKTSGEIIRFVPGADALASRTTVDAVSKSESGGFDLASTEIIVAGGRGMGGPESFEMLKELADVMGGTVAASRAAVDAGWISADVQIGQTGKTVAPKLYVAVGISGAVQHVVGMSSADTIIAIDKNPQAPIFETADIGLVGDLFEIIPGLIRRFRDQKPAGQAGAAADAFRN